MVNQQWGNTIIAPNGVFFEFETVIKIDLNRANRDKIYIDAGVFTPTKEYIVEVLGIDEQYFELGVRNEKLGVKPQQMTYSFNAVKQLLTANSSLLTDEEITPTEQALIYPFLVKVFDAMSKAETAQDFQAALNEMDFSDEEKTLINQHLPEIVAAYIKGMA